MSEQIDGQQIAESETERYVGLHPAHEAPYGETMTTDIKDDAPLDETFVAGRQIGKSGLNDEAFRQFIREQQVLAIRAKYPDLVGDPFEMRHIAVAYNFVIPAGMFRAQGADEPTKLNLDGGQVYPMNRFDLHLLQGEYQRQKNIQIKRQERKEPVTNFAVLEDNPFYDLTPNRLSMEIAKLYDPVHGSPN
jgi:hypothetical protein